MDWFVKKEDGSVYGPIALSDLKVWAIEGRIAPEDVISTDKEHWRAAYENEDLHMDWTLEMEDGSKYGPIHLFAFGEFLLDGSVTVDTVVTNKRHNVNYPLSEVLLPAALQSNNSLRNSLTELMEAEKQNVQGTGKTSVRETSEERHENGRAEQPLEEPTEIPEREHPEEPDEIPEREFSEEPRDIPESKPQTEIESVPSEKLNEIAEKKKKVEHWKSLYESEIAKAEEREENLDSQVRELQQEKVALTTELDQVKSELRRQKKKDAEFEEFAAKAEGAGEDRVAVLKSQFKSLLDSYNDLTAQYDRISSQITNQADELEELRETKAKIQKKADKRIQDMSEDLQRERKEADEAKSKLTEAEKNYTDLLRSYREMNDKLVKLRQQMA